MTVKIGVLWDSVTWEGEDPNEYEHINEAYRVFSEMARDFDAEVYLGNFEWYSGGVLEKAFYFDGKEWKKVRDIELDVVFDKVDLELETRELKSQMSDEVPTLNPYGLEMISDDKFESYRRFPDFIPEIREATPENVEDMLEEFGKVVIKPRSDYGGEGVKVIDSMDEFQPGENRLVQRFVDSTGGIPELGIEGVHDLRVLVMDGEPEAIQIRQPDSGLISNVHRGGETYFVDREDVPEEVFDIVDEVTDDFSEFDPAFYSIDFIFDPDGNPWILEFNSKPGLLFYDDADIKDSKTDLMERLLEVLTGMVDDED